MASGLWSHTGRRWQGRRTVWRAGSWRGGLNSLTEQLRALAARHRLELVVQHKGIAQRGGVDALARLSFGVCSSLSLCAIPSLCGQTAKAEETLGKISTDLPVDP